MAKLYSRAKMSVSGTPGTGAITLLAAYSNFFLTFAEAGVQNADVVPYVVEDGTDFEFGIGTYTAAGTSLSRDTVRASKIAGVAGTTKLTLTSAAVVYIDAAALDLLSITETQTANFVFAGPTSGGAAAPTFRASVLADLPAAYATSGQIAFPATQNASADANTLDDYEEGTFTPTITFATAGDLNVVYSTQVGRYTKIGRVVFIDVLIITTTFTHTTASGNFKIASLPFTFANDAVDAYGNLRWQGITLAGYTQMVSKTVVNTTQAEIRASASGSNVAVITTAEMPSGGNVQIGYSQAGVV